jgi:hypothetical protein
MGCGKPRCPLLPDTAKVREALAAPAEDADRRDQLQGPWRPVRGRVQIDALLRRPGAKYLVIGRVYDMEARQDLTAARLLALNPDLLAAGQRGAAILKRKQMAARAQPQRQPATPRRAMSRSASFPPKARSPGVLPMVRVSSSSRTSTAATARSSRPN